MNRVQNYILIAVGVIILWSCGTTKPVAQKKKKELTKRAQISKEDENKFEYLFIEALKNKALGNIEKATQLLTASLEINPNSAAAMFELANIYTIKNDLTSSSLLLEKAIKINPDNKWYKLLLAKIYQETSRYEKASKLYEKVLEQEPENQELLYLKASMLANAGKYTQAIDAYNRLEKKTGINEQLSVEKQQLYIAAGQPNKAFDEIEKLIESNPEEPKYYGLLADLYKSQGDTIAAKKYYNKILELDPQNGFVHFSLANQFLSEKNVNEAIKETKEGFKSDKVSLETKIKMYMILASNPKNNEVSEEDLDDLMQILLEKHADNYMVNTFYAEVLIKDEKFKEARAQLLKAVEQEKSKYVLWERILMLDNELQDWQSLDKHCRQVSEMFPNQAQVYFFNAIALFQLEKYDATIEKAEEGIDYVIDNKQLETQLIVLKGEANYKKNNKEEAYRLFDRALKRDPENYLTMNNYAYYLSLDGKNLDKAERMSGKVIEQFPNNGTYLDTHAWVLFKKGSYSLAKFYMESAISNEKEPGATLYEHYGDILFKSNKIQEALKHWKKALEMGGEVSKVLKKKIERKTYLEE